MGTWSVLLVTARSYATPPGTAVMLVIVVEVVVVVIVQTRVVVVEVKVSSL